MHEPDEPCIYRSRRIAIVLCMYKQSISMYISPYLILQSKARPRGCPWQQDFPTPRITANQRPCSATDGASPESKLLRIAVLAPRFYGRSQTKGLLSHATAFLLLALFGISLLSLLIFNLLFLLLAFDISHLTHLLCYLFSNVPACLLFLLSPSS